MEKKRYAILDDVRGLILISMMIYHAIWNVVYIFGENWLWYQSELVYYWQQSICWGFILLSGFCWSFGSNKWKRGITVLAAGALVSLVTSLAMPEEAIHFGVLTCLGSCMLLLIFLDKWTRKWKPFLGVIFAFGLFLVTRNINYGCLGFDRWKLVPLPGKWYANRFTAYLGFPPATFSSADYFSILPWFFLFLTGYFIYRLAEQKEWFAYLKLTKDASKGMLLEWLGRHSLVVYLLHQPIIYGVLYFCYMW